MIVPEHHHHQRFRLPVFFFKPLYVASVIDKGIPDSIVHFVVFGWSVCCKARYCFALRLIFLCALLNYRNNRAISAQLFSLVTLLMLLLCVLSSFNPNDYI